MPSDAELEGIFNFRDLGGVAAPSRPDLLYRADGLHRTDQLGRDRLVANGIRTVIDLRTDAELTREGRFDHPEVAFHHVPIVEDLSDLMQASTVEDNLMLDHYRIMTSTGGTRFAEALGLIGASLSVGRPVVFHCTAGKDRTGILAALILHALGVDDDTIAADYGRSSDAVPHLVAWYERHGHPTPPQKMTEMGMPASAMQRLMASEPTTMHQMLADLRAQFTSIENYLDGLGAADAVRQIRAALL